MVPITGELERALMLKVPTEGLTTLLVTVGCSDTDAVPLGTVQTYSPVLPKVQLTPEVTALMVAEPVYAVPLLLSIQPDALEDPLEATDAAEAVPVAAM